MNYEEYLKENPEFADRKRQKKAKKRIFQITIRQLSLPKLRIRF